MANDIVYLEHFNKLKSLMTNVRRTGDFVRLLWNELDLDITIHGV